MPLVPLVRLNRVAAWARRAGVPAEPVPTNAALLTLHPPTASGLDPEVHAAERALSVRLALFGALTAEQTARLTGLVATIQTRQPAPSVAVVELDSLSDGAAPSDTVGADPDQSPRTPYGISVEVYTPVDEGLTDTQIDAFMSWAVPFVTTVGAELVSAVPLRIHNPRSSQ